MSKRLETEHRGYKLGYSENNDEWTCYDLGVGSKSLACAKGMIDKLLLIQRKKHKVDCLRLGRDGTVKPASIIEYLGHSRSYRGTQVASVAYMATNGGADRPSRSTGLLNDFAADTQEVREALIEVVTLHDRAARLTREAARKLEEVPRLRDADIAELIRLRGTGAQEGELP